MTMHSTFFKIQQTARVLKVGQTFSALPTIAIPDSYCREVTPLPILSTGISKPYPNPAKSGFSIDYNLGKDAKAQLTFYSPTGNIQASYTLTGNGTYNIATAEWVSGMYYYRVITENGSIISGKVAVFK